MSGPRRVGLLVGREQSFPNALIEEVARRDQGVVCELATIDTPRSDEVPPYAVIVDRISHEVTCYQPWLKLAALNGTRIVNNPFWRIADDKFFNAALAQKLGVSVPRTALLPNHSYGPDVTAGSLRNLRLVDWERFEQGLGGYPLFLKPHWGGGWKDVYRVNSREELWRAYDRTGTLTMIAQEAIEWQQYVRCIVIGTSEVRVALWDPRLSHFERYTQAPQSMVALEPALETRIVADAQALCRALGYDMNTVEFAVRDGIPYAIDYMNSAPDLDLSSLGPDHFAWVVEKMADLVIAQALEDPAPVRLDARSLLGGAPTP